MWFKLASAAGRKGPKIAKKKFKEFLNREQIAKAEQLGREWMLKNQ